MFFIRVHSVDTNNPLNLETFEFTNASILKKSPPFHPQEITNASILKKSPPWEPPTSTSKFTERRGVTHLFRAVAPSSSENHSTVLFVIAVPSSFSCEDFLRFCGTCVDHIADLVFIRNDAMEDRYSVMVKITNQAMADNFYYSLNGKNFSPSEAEVCHILFLRSVEFTDSADIAGTPPDGCTELPTCPVCIERLDPDSSGILTAICDHSFQCSCTSKWTNVSCQVCRFFQPHDDIPTCSVCGTSENLWVCVICGFVGCGRYKEGHAIRHWKETQHRYSLELPTQLIWDYVGDNFVHRLNHSKVEKTYSQCLSVEGDCGDCACSEEESGYSGALYSSKVDAIMDEYNHLLASQLEAQRQFYESLVSDAKSKVESRVSVAVEKAVVSKMQDIQNKLDNSGEEKILVASVNRKLIKDQEVLRKKFKEIEERESAAVKLRDEKILDLEEQIRDLTVFIGAQKTLKDMEDSDGIRGGTVLPMRSEQSSQAGGKKPTKSGRRRN